MKKHLLIFVRNTNMQDTPGGADNTRCKTNKMTTMSHEKLSSIFCIVLFRRERYSNEGIGAPRCGGAKEIPMSCCMCEPMETAQSLWRRHTCGGHAAKVGTRARTAHLVWFLTLVGCEPGPSKGARHKDAGKHERKTPTPCATYRQMRTRV